MTTSQKSGWGCKILFSVLFTLLLLEGVLRLMPGAIPLDILYFFNSTLRSQIAQGRVSTYNDTVVIPRDDGGPELRVWKPFLRKMYRSSDPGTVACVPADEIGFCNPIGTATSNTTVEIVTIGDSFTWGHAVHPQDTWSFQTEQITGQKVLNLGKGGTGPYEYLQILKTFGLAKKPKIVVMNIYEGNDIRNALAYYEYKGKGSLKSGPAPFSWKDLPLLKRLYAYNFIGGALNRLVVNCRQSYENKRVDFRYVVDPAGAQILFNRYQVNRDEVTLPNQIATGEISLELFDAALDSFAQLAQTHHFIPVLMYTPSAYIVYAPVEFKDPELESQLSRASSLQRAYFSAKARERGLRFLDLTEALRARAFPIPTDLSQLLYYPANLHYTARGHRVVAEALSQLLQTLDSASEK